MLNKESYYAYYIVSTKESGIVDNWKDCELKVKGKDSRYKKFLTKEEAQKWLEDGPKYSHPKSSFKKKVVKEVQLKEGIYFDSGTGRGDGTEVRVTNLKGEPLLDPNITNKFGNYYLGKDYTNNYGELLGLYFALEIAIKNNIKNIYGDSSLVIKYWSKNKINDNVANQTKELAKKVSELREIYVKSGGKIYQISGDVNPADLGFHKSTS